MRKYIQVSIPAYQRSSPADQRSTPQSGSVDQRSTLVPHVFAGFLRTSEARRPLRSGVAVRTNGNGTMGKILENIQRRMEKMLKRFWMMDDNPPTQPGCFVIPSYALKNASLPTLPTRAQIELAIEWWKKFPEAKLIMSTGDNQRLGIPNSRVMAEYAISLGLPRENVIEEDRSLNTHQNLLYSMQIIKAQNLGQPTLVTLDLYTRRAVATAQKMGWKNFHWLSVFSKGDPAYGYKWLQTYSRTTLFCYEVGAMIFSKVVGWV